jgi:uroporphyrinogen decarboxylase
MHLTSPKRCTAGIMTSRERVTASIEFGSPDRVPVWHQYLDGFAWEHSDFLKEMFALCPGDACVHREQSDEDAVPRKPSPNAPEMVRGRTYRDEWGCLWQYEEPGMQGIVVEHPVLDYDLVKDYPIPDVARIDFESMRAELAGRQMQRYVWLWAPNLFHLLTFVLGYERFVVDLTLEEPGLFELMERIVQIHHIPYIRELCRCNCDAVFFGDDLGTQQQLMVAPEVWRKTMKELYRRQFEVVKDCGKHVILHSDGYILDIIPDLMEIGLDALNPQHEIMDARELTDIVRGKLCILTDVDRQEVLPFGSTGDVRRHVADIKDKFYTPEGGIVFHGELAVDVPLQNIKAMYESFQELRA